MERGHVRLRKQKTLCYVSVPTRLGVGDLVYHPHKGDAVGIIQAVGSSKATVLWPEAGVERNKLAVLTSAGFRSFA